MENMTKKDVVWKYSKLALIGLLIASVTLAVFVIIFVNNGETASSLISDGFIYGLIGITIAGFCMPFGWHTINYMTRNTVVVSIPGMWFLFKFIVSFAMGWLTLPVYIVKFIIDIIRA